MSAETHTAACCPPGSLGPAAGPEGYVLKGKEVELKSDLTMYVVEPTEKTDRAILVMHDIFGPDSGRTKQICDEYAAKGYIVCLPYLLRNDPLTDPDTYGWFGKLFSLVPAVKWLHSNKWDVVGPLLLDHVMPYMKETLGAKNIGIACFCWGNYPMLNLLAEKDETVKCGCGFHPSLNLYLGLMDPNGRKKIIDKVDNPVMMLVAGNDPSDVQPGGLADKEFQRKSFYCDCMFKTYPDMIHGWVNRGDLKNENVLRDYQDAIKLSDEFFAKHV